MKSAIPETGLDYFGARYFSGAQGRFTGADPLGPNAVRMLNPQRWNMYSYALGNPLFYTDPDGRDAVVVDSSSDVMGAGHLAAISVLPNGTATYAEAYATHGRGVDTMSTSVPYTMKTALEFDGDHFPTKASFDALRKEVANLTGTPVDSIGLAYFKMSDTDTQLFQQYVERAKPLACYIAGAVDCATWVLGGLDSAHAHKPLTDFFRVFSEFRTPNLVFGYLITDADTSVGPGSRNDDRRHKHKAAPCLKDRGTGQCRQ